MIQQRSFARVDKNIWRIKFSCKKFLNNCQIARNIVLEIISKYFLIYFFNYSALSFKGLELQLDSSMFFIPSLLKE